MPFDGVVTKCAAEELSQILTGGRIEKIFQPENDEIIINIRAKSRNLKLLLSASANYPRIHLTETVKENPQEPPVFCMLLRKHLSGGRITGVEFYDYERIIGLCAETVNELGDTAYKKLIIEIMGRHSNIILLSQEGKIIDSIKHVDNDISSVREVMPARQYAPPPAQNKHSIEKIDLDTLMVNSSSVSDNSVEKYLLQSIKGFSPLLCREVCYRSALEEKSPASDLDSQSLLRLRKELVQLALEITEDRFAPCIIYDNREQQLPIDFHCVTMTQYSSVKYLESISQVLDLYYREKDKVERLKQKKSDLYKVLGNSLDRCNKKIALQQDALRDAAEREKFKLYGELITANIYCIPKNTKSISLLNYYSEDGSCVDIPLDENMSPQENAQRYFKRYSKAKNTFIHTTRQLEDSQRELDYLESVSHLLDSCSTIQEIDEIRQELAEQGYVSKLRKKPAKRQDKASEPLRYRSSDGLDIYVGKNNKQNDMLTMKLASSNDIWLHTRNIPGSHVIIRKSRQSIPDSTLLEAAMLAAYHSRARHSSGVAVDYTAVKNVKKPSGAKPGMVNYENFKTIIATPDESLVGNLRFSHRDN